MYVDNCVKYVEDVQGVKLYLVFWLPHLKSIFKTNRFILSECDVQFSRQF